MKKRTCKVCGVELTNNKTKKKEYCDDHNPAKVWHRLDERFKANNTHLIKKAESIHFNFHYELEQLKKLICVLDCAAPQELTFINKKLSSMLGTLQEVTEEIEKVGINEIKGNHDKSTTTGRKRKASD